MTTAITKLLAKIETPGTFATRLSAPAESLEIDVKGVGPLTFPITAKAAKKLRSVATASPFGLRDKTLHDDTVRNSWEVPASNVKIAKPWNATLAPLLRAIKTQLGIAEDCELEVVLDKLLIYEKGQFFKPHQDSEKDDAMLGTLVVILPSEYAGGTVTVAHAGKKKEFRRVSGQGTELSLLAFYADCHHAVGKLTSGVRVALTYQLRLSGNSKPTLSKSSKAVVDDVMVALRKYFSPPRKTRSDQSEPPPERFVYLLDHEYTKRTLQWTRLKNGDRARVAALREAAVRLDYECFLAIAEIYEYWNCEDDSWDRFDRKRRSREDKAQADKRNTQPPKYRLVELSEWDIELRHWLDVDGKQRRRTTEWIGVHELHFTTPSSKLAPVKSKYEGYQGNYGNTLERWYHRAALILWPKSMPNP